MEFAKTRPNSTSSGNDSLKNRSLALSSIHSAHGPAGYAYGGRARAPPPRSPRATDYGGPVVGERTSDRRGPSPGRHLAPRALTAMDIACMNAYLKAKVQQLRSAISRQEEKNAKKLVAMERDLVQAAEARARELERTLLDRSEQFDHQRVRDAEMIIALETQVQELKNKCEEMRLERDQAERR